MKRIRTKIDGIDVVIDIHPDNTADVLIKRGHFVVKECYNVKVEEEEIPHNNALVKRRRCGRL